MKVAVLGSRGFLGSYITNYLTANNITVMPITRDNLNLTSHNEVHNWLQSHRPNVIVNCATSSVRSAADDQRVNDIQNNINIFLNFYNNDEYFDKFINIGSGAEFDLTRSIDQVTESDILNVHPTQSYGFSKNIISRMVLEKRNFFTLRLFGCFDVSEPDFRLLKKLYRSECWEIIDRQFDFFSASDFCRVLEYYVNNNDLIKDVNCVYNEKLHIQQVVDRFVKFHNLKQKPHVLENQGLHYTGCSKKLDSLNLKLDGLDAGLKLYKG